jgi:hypothetical protein
MSKKRTDSVGKRVIHPISGKTGIITKEVIDSNQLNDTTVSVELDSGGMFTAHRHYFWIEGGNYPGDTSFEDNKEKYYKE